MRCIVKVEHVYQLVKSNNDNALIYVNKSGKLIKNNEILFDGFVCEVVKEWNNGFIINEQFYLSPSNHCEYLFEEENIFCEFIINDSHLFVKEIDFVNEEVVFGTFNNATKSISKFGKIESRPYKVSNDKLITIHNCMMNCFGFEDTKVDWVLSVQELLGSEKAELHGNIIEQNGILFFFLSDFNKSATFGIDINNGEIKFKSDRFSGWLTVDNNLIYAINQQTISILDPVDFTEQFIDFTEVLQPLGLIPVWNKFRVKGDKLYFVHENITGGGAARVGILSLSKKALLWQTQIPIETGQYWITDIQVQNDRLFVLTQGGTLHVFENEK